MFLALSLNSNKYKQTTFAKGFWGFGVLGFWWFLML